MGILLGVKKMVAVTLAAASDITSELGRHCPSPITNTYKHKLYCTRVLSCTYFTICDVIHLIIWVLSLRRSIISNRKAVQDEGDHCASDMMFHSHTHQVQRG